MTMGLGKALEDNARVEDLGEEPEGFWTPVHARVAEWVAKYGGTEDDDDDA